jgi:signal transduction histidine kinase
MSESTTDLRAARLITAGELAASLAHDWNNFLTILTAQAAEISESLPADHPAHAVVGEMLTSIRLAADQPRRLLAWLRATPGVKQPVPIGAVIEEAAPLFRLAAGPRARCEFSLAAAEPPVSLDKPLFIHAVLNMVNNAAQAMDSRGRITIATKNQNGHVLFSISDTGKGMSEETRLRLFEPFYSTRHGAGGTGLGMLTIHRLVEDHAARIEIISAPGQGARFEIAFPISNG